MPRQSLARCRECAEVGIGVASVCVNLYIQEMVPAKVRGCLGSLAPFLGSGGMMAGMGISAGGAPWRLLCLIGALPAVLQLAGALAGLLPAACPGSPRAPTAALGVLPALAAAPQRPERAGYLL